jgi:hypothetical protein
MPKKHMEKQAGARRQRVRLLFASLCCGQPPAGAATTSSAPAFFLLLLKLMMLTGVLDAFDLTVIAQCTREARDAVAYCWEGVRTKNPATRLRSVERLVEDRALNKTGFDEYVLECQAAECVMCGAVTQRRHIVDGSMLCAPCGRKGRFAWAGSPFFRFRMICELLAKDHLGISTGSDLGKHLRFAEWRVDPKKSGTGYYSKYPPGFAAADEIGLNGRERARALARFSSYVSLGRVFLLREVICLLLEKYGGPRLLKERIRNHALPALDPAKPDE